MLSDIVKGELSILHLMTAAGIAYILISITSLSLHVANFKQQRKWEFYIMHDKAPGLSGYVLLLIVQIVFIVVFGVVTDYHDELKPKNGTQSEEGFIVPKYARKSTQI